MKASEIMLQRLGVSAEELRLIARRQSREPDETSNRQYAREEYSLPDGVVIEMLDPAATPEFTRVLPCDISAGGMGVLMCGWLSGGAALAAYLPRSATNLERIQGHVVRCFSLTRDVYDVGVKFDDVVDIDPLLTYARQESSG